MRAERAAEAAQDYDVRDLMDGATLLASTANMIMQLAQPQVGYAVVGLRAAHPDDSDRQPGPAGADLPVPVQRLPG